jgi:glycosyltransferase involved in cell wall biosynthesis
MKGLIISGNWFGGGAESVSRELFDFLRLNGHECYYAYSSGKAPQDRYIIKCGTEIEHYFHALISRLFDLDGYGSFFSTHRLINLIKKIKPDIISVQNVVCYSYNFKMLFAFLNNEQYKTVWTLHDCWSFTGHCISFEEVKCDKWKYGCGKCPGLRNYPKSILFDNSKNNLLRKKNTLKDNHNLFVVTPSLWLAKIIRNTYLAKYPIKVIHNGIDLELFNPISSDLLNDFDISNKKVILCVASRWTKSKGLQYVTAASNIMDKNLYQFVVIGDVEKDNNVLSEDIIYIKRTNNRKELIQWYSVADVFVNPTQADNFPTVNIEALACGTPVVTFDTGGSWESVGDKCGVLVKEVSVNALVRSIELCLNRKIKKEDCIKQAENFRAAIKYAEYEMYFETILSNSDS